MKNLLTEIYFRQTNSLVIYLVNASLSRNFCQKRVRVNFCNFHTLLCTVRKLTNFFTQTLSNIFGNWNQHRKGILTFFTNNLPGDNFNNDIIISRLAKISSNRRFSRFFFARMRHFHVIFVTFNQFHEKKSFHFYTFEWPKKNTVSYK